MNLPWRLPAGTERCATGPLIGPKPPGVAHLHTAVSGVAHYLAKDDADCLLRIRQGFRQMPEPRNTGHAAVRPPVLDPQPGATGFGGPPVSEIVPSGRRWLSADGAPRDVTE